MKLIIDTTREPYLFSIDGTIPGDDEMVLIVFRADGATMTRTERLSDGELHTYVSILIKNPPEQAVEAVRDDTR